MFFRFLCKLTVASFPTSVNHSRSTCSTTLVPFAEKTTLEYPSSNESSRPTKGSYGFHDGLHNLLWKGDAWLKNCLVSFTTEVEVSCLPLVTLVVRP